MALQISSLQNFNNFHCTLMRQFGVIQPLHYSHTMPPRMTSRKAVGEPDSLGDLLGKGTIRWLRGK